MPESTALDNENDLIKARYDHLAALLKRGIDPYPAKVLRTHSITEARELWRVHQQKWSATPGAPARDADVIWIVGRIVALRSHGGATFADIEDGTGKLQLLVQQSEVKEYDLWSLFDLGDFVQVRGRLFLTKRDELTLHVEDFDLISKSLRPLPDKWHGLEDKETRFRERYADLIANPDVRELFRIRARVVQTLRQKLEEAQFMEVETPVLQPLAGGATAKPFITHYNAYDTEVFLRVAPELYHKRLIVGGYERVYEFARCFRNEGVDHAHNPEFTNLEFYAAYWDYEQLMVFTEQLLRAAVQAANGSPHCSYKGKKIDFDPPFARISFREAVMTASGIDILREDEQSLRHRMTEKKIEAPEIADFGKLCDYLYKATVRPQMVQPTLLLDHPIALSPLAKKNGERLVQRFQVIAAGEFELCNAFSELNDPIDQRERFLAQMALRERGDEEAQAYDADYIRALEYGMPPTAGFGLGVDRLVALLTGSQTLREVILFPYMKPKTEK